MKIKLTYFTRHEMEIEITPEEYCKLHADNRYNGYFPSDSYWRKIEIGDAARERLDEFFAERENKSKEMEK